MTTRETVLAVDAGQTGMKVRYRDADGRVWEETHAGIRTDGALLPQIAEVARAVTRRSPAPGPLTLAAGVSGLTSREADADQLLAMLHDLPVHRVALAHDSTTSYLGALGDARGAVVAAGTGVVTLAVGPDRLARVDGWGNLLGDAGSGYWIGREALDAVMRDFDGRGPATPLRALAEERWPLLTEAYIDLQTAPDRVRTIASFAAPVAALAAAGDPVALRITDRAAAELAHSVATALHRVMPEGGALAPVCTIGGVFHSQPLTERFAAHLAASGVPAQIVPAQGSGLDGVVALAALASAHPLSSAISSAASIVGAA
ncbi:BadF/BadG/BcrA/BcrD ATPase family protein [Microbacterium sp. NPDC089189]|uniref:N-acetylglucosamine kinase n=1 Tax=Microbacterium sp. NPDC089189 TaxID=3154972 RepID=UPI0034167E5C